MELLLKGIVIGFAIAAPVGPIGLLCIRRTLVKGHLAGFSTGLGAALADAVYGFVAAYGITLVGHLLIDHRAWLSLFGGVFLVVLGGAEWRSRPPVPTEANGAASSRLRDAAGLLHGFVSTFFLTLANPMTILSFAAIFAGAGLAGPDSSLGEPDGELAPIAQLVGGVFLGSASWWAMLTGGVGRIRHMLGPQTQRWLNRISGTALIGFGLYALAIAIDLFLKGVT